MTFDIYIYCFQWMECYYFCDPLKVLNSDHIFDRGLHMATPEPVSSSNTNLG